MLIPLVVNTAPVEAPVEPPPPPPPPDTAPVVVAPGAAPVGFVLVRIVPEDVVVDAGLTVATAGEAISAGNRTAPLPTWPLPRVPGVGFADCAAAGCTTASASSAAKAKIPFIPTQHRSRPKVPDIGKATSLCYGRGIINANGLSWRRQQTRWARRPCRS
jgi:hypothetical protein